MLKRTEKERRDKKLFHYSKGSKKCSGFHIYVCSKLCWKLPQYHLWSECIQVPEIVFYVWLLVITLGLSHFLLKCVISTTKMNRSRKTPSLKVAPSWNFSVVHLSKKNFFLRNFGYLVRNQLAVEESCCKSSEILHKSVTLSGGPHTLINTWIGLILPYMSYVNKSVIWHRDI